MSRLSQSLSKEERRFIHKAKMAGKKFDRERRFREERRKIDLIEAADHFDPAWLDAIPLHSNPHTQTFPINVGEIIHRRNTEGKTDE